MSDPLWIVWSFEHQGWWRPAHRGYTATIAEAGLYTEAEAKRIQDDANWIPGEGHPGPPVVNEQAMPLEGAVDPVRTGHAPTDRRTAALLQEPIRQRDTLMAFVHRVKAQVPRG